MTKRSPETLAEFVEAVADTGSVANAARKVGISISSAWSWMAQSRQGQSGFDLEYMGQSMPLHEAVKQAQRVVGATILDNFQLRLLKGTQEVSRYQGKTVFKRDPKLDLLSDQDLTDLAITTRYLLDDEGNPIPEVIHHEPPVAAVISFLQATYPKTWGHKIEVSNRSTAASGVQVVPRMKPAAAINAPAEPPVDVEPKDLTDILGPDDESVPATIELEVTPAPEPGPSAEAVEPGAESASPAEPEPPSESLKPLSALQLDLMARLAQRSNATKPAPVMVSSGRIEADDLDPRRNGAGTPPKGAVKVV
ncbi:hypothetical protein XH83_33805 [Bradyrhizobium sp. CCBAU 53351]|uniref:hypothetical protein n=1 Tax=Bradyrhizobium sp. CCBAU 53351 TaxID=1325114 RepID=UPI0018875C50|nr:hypothetical protein [Bradyrhizobium sp. CCBAU 53351]QOZ79922.1 hypothetical protein XH83_33805 [Bradyrhizobium sp. CCBAU 53351]